MKVNEHKPSPSKTEKENLEMSGVSRRELIRGSLAVAGAAIAVPTLLSGLAHGAQAHSNRLGIAPKYYPVRNFRPDIDLDGKLAVITGASRGQGRAIGERLIELGVKVIGTSRNPAGVPNPPSFPLLQLDIADQESVFSFPARLQALSIYQTRGKVDILANNAGRIVFGRIVPLSPTDFEFYLSQRELGMRTLYSGHVMMTNVMLPLMAQEGYARILFTVSIASYYSGATSPAGSSLEAYSAAKSALRFYANNLGSALVAGGSNIRVSTVNPYIMNTRLGTYPNPIYTQPVNDSGRSDTDPIFNAGLDYFAQLMGNALPPTMAAETYAQLLRMADPERNVVVASPREPLATQGANDMIEPEILRENSLSAVPFV